MMKGNCRVAEVERKNCEFYPCHIEEFKQAGLDPNIQDCDFCFCPFYPCLERALGQLTTEGTWDCSHCILPHIPEVASFIRHLEKHLFGVLRSRYRTGIEKQVTTSMDD